METLIILIVTFSLAFTAAGIIVAILTGLAKIGSAIWYAVTDALGITE